MNTNAVCTAVAAKAVGIAGVRGASSVVPETIPAAPWVIVGSHSATSGGGTMGRRRIDYTFPLRCYVERTADAGRTETMVNDLVDAFVNAYEAGINYGGTATEGRITSWNTDLYASIGGSDYQVIEFSLSMRVDESSNFSP